MVAEPPVGNEISTLPDVDLGSWMRMHAEIDVEFISETWPTVEHWWVSGELLDENDESGQRSTTVCTAEVMRVHLDGAENAWDALDAIEADLEAVASAVLDPATGEVRPEIEDNLEFVQSAFLIVNRVQVDERMAHRGIGRWIVAEAVELLGGGCGFAALYPAPIDGREGVARERSVAALTQVWATLGFEPVGGNVMVLDLALISWAEALAACRRRFGLEA